jgi:polygalacturonase
MSTVVSIRRSRQLGCFAFIVVVGTVTYADDHAPKSDERQLPLAMHSQMSERPTITVGRSDADLLGTDNRALQAAVDYVAGLGGGTVEIREGEYVMRDSLHLHSNVTVRGQRGKTILRKANAAVSPLALDGDFGEQQITVESPSGFTVGAGVAIWDDNAGGFHTTVARITGRRGKTFAIDVPLQADCMVSKHGTAATVFALISGTDIQGARVEDLVIDGNKAANPPLNGCRGGGIYLYRGFGTVIRGCVARNFHGDGISFQQSNDVTVEDCVSEDNSDLGFHPGSGSQRPIVRNCIARHNGTDGLFLCWRVRHGLFENNLLEANGRFGISIGHKDSDNLLRGNKITANASNGVCFRDETAGMAPHRNRLNGNVIEDNGRKTGTAGIRICGEPSGLVFEDNVIRDTRPSAQQTQTLGILVEDRVGPVEFGTNRIEASKAVDDRRDRQRHSGSLK